MPKTDVLPKAPIPFPLRGLSENYALAAGQEPGTTRDLLNVRAIDPKTGRSRGAQRSGLNRFLDDTLSGGGTEIQEIVAVPRNQTQLTYASDTTPATGFAVTLPNSDSGIDMAQDEFGNLYVTQPAVAAAKYNQDGSLLATIDIPDSSDNSGLENIAFITVDQFQNVYVGRGVISSATAANQAESRLYCFQFQLDGTYKLAWALDSGRFFNDAVLHTKANGKVDLFTAESDYVNGDGFFCAYRDVDTFSAPTEDTTSRATLDNESSGGISIHPWRIAKRDDGVCYVTGSDLGSTTALDAELWKVNPYQDDPTQVIWTATLATGDIDGGIGFGVAVGPKNSDGDYTVYTCGNSDVSGGQGTIRRMVDTGTTLNDTGTDYWIAVLAEEWSEAAVGTRRLRLATDHDGNVYVPAPTSNSDAVLIYDADGTGAAGEELNSFDLTGTTTATTLAVAVPQTKPAGFDDAGIVETEHVFFSSVNTSGVAFYRADLATVTQATASFRAFRLLAMGGGDIETFAAGGSFADTAGGTGVGVLDSAAPYVQSVVSVARFDADDEEKGRLRAYITDGQNYVKYDPEDDACSTWTSATAGVIPPRCRLIEVWQGRVVLARDPENPTAWHMSAINNPEDWDTAPQNISPAQAVSGFNSKIGNVPDVVNCIVPWDDDLLLFGCDHSIWAMRGNPLMGGQYDKVTLEHGMAFGRPYCFSHDGQTLFYMDTLGGVHALNKGGTPLRITRDRIERRMRDAINWGTHYVRLAWNRDDEGLHVVQIPYDGASGAIVKAWFWDRKNDFWGEDQYGNSSDTAKQPTAIFTLDGDAPTDRVLLFGCEDGYIRAWDKDALSDDNTASTDLGVGHGGSDLAIDSYVTIGPIEPRRDEIETQFQDMTTWFAYDQDGVHYSWYLGDEPDDILNHAPKVTGTLPPGRSPLKIQKFVADTAYVRFRNASPAQRWAFEKATIGYVPGGEKKGPR
jgi:hypothetical protein